MDDSRFCSSRSGYGTSTFPLPLDLIALIISFLDRPSDLGRMCRTCRVFHYMTLPQLYSNVSLRSYDHIRYNERDRRPEGAGMASPFSMGLSGLVSRNVADYVKSFEVCGEWKEYEVHEHAKAGRVPDGTLMLSSLVRAAIERMPVLDSFSWELNTKMLPTVWQGLAQKSTLTKLSIKFPTKRHPRPITLIPPLPNLQYLTIHEIDPLCYADDISACLLGSKNLRHLKMHFSPRMREMREPSVHPSTYFGKCEAVNYLLPLKSMAVHNVYGPNANPCTDIFEPKLIEEITFLNSTGGLGDDSSTVFGDPDWKVEHSRFTMPRLRMLRLDKVSQRQCDFIANFSGIERLYLIGPQSKTSAKSHSIANNTPTPTSLPHSPPSSYSSPSSLDANCLSSLKDLYLDAITKAHGPTLRHLLLLPHWRLTKEDIARLIRHCPNLEQLAFGTELDNFSHMSMLVPFLSKLTAIRLLPNPDDPTFLNQMRDLDQCGMHAAKMEEDMAKWEWARLRYFELGDSEMLFEVGKRYRVESEMGGQWRREVRRRRLEDVVGGMEVWRLDSLDI